MRFARWVFAIAGVYGLIVLTPFYFLEDQIGRDNPPAITHPEYFYGFIGIALAWQIAFLVIAMDPLRYRLLMIPSILEKAAFAVSVPLLFAQGRVAGPVVAFSMVDATLGILFLAAFWLTRRAHTMSA
jgi:hypothetical protein